MCHLFHGASCGPVGHSACISSNLLFAYHSKHTIFHQPSVRSPHGLSSHDTIHSVLVRSAISTRHDWHAHTCPAYYITPFHVTFHTPTAPAQLFSSSPALMVSVAVGCVPRISVLLDLRVFACLVLLLLGDGSHCAPRAIPCLNLI